MEHTGAQIRDMGGNSREFPARSLKRRRPVRRYTKGDAAGLPPGFFAQAVLVVPGRPGIPHPKSGCPLSAPACHLERALEQWRSIRRYRVSMPMLSKNAFFPGCGVAMSHEVTAALRDKSSRPK